MFLFLFLEKTVRFNALSQLPVYLPSCDQHLASGEQHLTSTQL